MTDRLAKTAAFRALHAEGCFIMPNVWDAGGAHLFAGLGFSALATTSAGFAFTTGRRDGAGAVDLDEALAHAAKIVDATDLPVSADLENGYADASAGLVETVERAAAAGLAGVSIEDVRPDRGAPIYAFDAAVARIEAAAGAARAADIVLTARADGLMSGAYDLDEAIRRLRAFAVVGAEVVYAPGLGDIEQIARVCREVERPVNHVIGLGAPGQSLATLETAGVRRISLGGSLARATLGALLEAGRAMQKGQFDLAESGPGWGSILTTMKNGRPV